MDTFKDWIVEEDGNIGYILAAIARNIPVGHPVLKEDSKSQMSFFDNKTKKPVEDKKVCPITPLSGYDTHIKAIQSFAHSGPDQFAQVMMFSPLSARAPFAKHWDNFQVLMMILKHTFSKKKLTREELEGVLKGFGDYQYTLLHTINGFKLDTIEYIWNNRQSLFQELNSIAKEGDDAKLIARLIHIKGVQPVKAGFMVQLLWGRAGCIDVHNIAIYSKAFPDLAHEINPKLWDSDPTTDGSVPDGVQNYVKFLDKLKTQKGIGTKQLWDVWVDFVENMYRMISTHGMGNYADFGSALNPNDPEYAALRGMSIDKVATGRGGSGEELSRSIPVISGRWGMGASATHLQDEPEEMLRQFSKMDRGEKGSEGASSVPYHNDALGRPLDPMNGLGSKPAALHYFGQAIDDSGHVDHDKIKHIIQQRMAKGTEKANRQRFAKTAQQSLF